MGPMTPNELIQAAREAIGGPKDDDYVIVPSTHASTLGASASAFAAVLGGSRIAGVAREYARHDAEGTEKGVGNLYHHSHMHVPPLEAHLVKREAEEGNTSLSWSLLRDTLHAPR